LDRTIDPCAVEEFFALGYIAEPRSIYSNVRQLPSGMSLTLRRGQKAQMQSYWDPAPATIDQHELNNLDDALLERLGRIVKSQLVADVPVGAFLSGGVDSSGTMALMARQTQGPITAFTIGFNDRAFDETKYAAAVADHYGSKHEIARMDGGETDLVESLPAIFDEPFGDSSALPSYRLMQLARKSVTVALSGDGGDELFAGYRRYGFHAREESIRRWLPGAIRTPLFGTLANLYPQLDRAPRFLRARNTFRELSSDSTTGYFWNLSVVGDETRKSLFSTGLTKSLGGYHAVDVVARHAKAAPTDDPVTMAQYIDLKSWLPSDILVKVDRTAMANSLEVRVPMLDHGFVNWALGLPSAVNRRGSDGKILLKRAFARLVPPNVLHRPKQGFSVPLARWFRGTMGQHLDQKLSSKTGLASAQYRRSSKRPRRQQPCAMADLDVRGIHGGGKQCRPRTSRAHRRRRLEQVSPTLLGRLPPQEGVNRTSQHRQDHIGDFGGSSHHESLQKTCGKQDGAYQRSRNRQPHSRGNQHQQSRAIEVEFLGEGNGIDPQRAMQNAVKGYPLKRFLNFAELPRQHARQDYRQQQ
jgi:asparagine synthase (glutamine-hydrolysing)